MSNPRLNEWLMHEAERLQAARPVEWEAGQQVLLEVESLAAIYEASVRAHTEPRQRSPLPMA